MRSHSASPWHTHVSSRSTTPSYGGGIVLGLVRPAFSHVARFRVALRSSSVVCHAPAPHVSRRTWTQRRSTSRPSSSNAIVLCLDVHVWKQHVHEPRRRTLPLRVVVLKKGRERRRVASRRNDRTCSDEERGVRNWEPGLQRMTGLERFLFGSWGIRG